MSYKLVFVQSSFNDEPSGSMVKYLSIYSWIIGSSLNVSEKYIFYLLLFVKWRLCN